MNALERLSQKASMYFSAFQLPPTSMEVSYEDFAELIITFLKHRGGIPCLLSTGVVVAKSEDYYYDADAIREPFTNTDKRVGTVRDRSSESYAAVRGDKRAGRKSPKDRSDGQAYASMRGDRGSSGGYPKTHEGRNKRTVWTLASTPFKGFEGSTHFATFPTKLIEPCILAGSDVGDWVLDPFSGAATTGVVSKEHGRKFVGCEVNYEYIQIAKKRGYMSIEAIEAIEAILQEHSCKFIRIAYHLAVPANDLGHLLDNRYNKGWQDSHKYLIEYLSEVIKDETIKKLLLDRLKESTDLREY